MIRAISGYEISATHVTTGQDMGKEQSAEVLTNSLSGSFCILQSIWHQRTAPAQPTHIQHDMSVPLLRSRSARGHTRLSVPSGSLRDGRLRRLLRARAELNLRRSRTAGATREWDGARSRAKPTSMISSMSSSKSGIGWIGSFLVLTFLRGRGEPPRHSTQPEDPDGPPECDRPVERVDTTKRSAEWDTALTL
jgi:hypothetical protein